MSLLSVETKKVTELETITEADGSGLIPFHDGSGLKNITLDDMFDSAIESAAMLHNAQPRREYLGTEVSDDFYERLAAGNYEGIYPGQYWTINGFNWSIWDCGYYYGSGDTNCTTPHVVVVPDTALYTAQMNSSDTTEGGYIGSEMYTTNLAEAGSIIEDTFGSEHILSFREYLTNAVTSGYPSAGAWTSVSWVLMNEIMVYGCPIYLPAGDGSTTVNRYTVAKRQLSLARYMSEIVNIRSTYWLRDVVTAAYFAYVASSGHAYSHSASHSYGVRPAFCLKAIS